MPTELIHDGGRFTLTDQWTDDLVDKAELQEFCTKFWCKPDAIVLPNLSPLDPSPSNPPPSIVEIASEDSSICDRFLPYCCGKLVELEEYKSNYLRICEHYVAQPLAGIVLTGRSGNG